jgi:hypothetical protein
MEYAIPRSPRYPFIAIAEIIHPESGGILGSRVAKINLNGCYVDTSKTIPAGSKVVIKILLNRNVSRPLQRLYMRIPIQGWGLRFERYRQKVQRFCGSGY